MRDTKYTSMPGFISDGFDKGKADAPELAEIPKNEIRTNRLLKTHFMKIKLNDAGYIT